jgi:CHAT domain-containing protein
MILLPAAARLGQRRLLIVADGALQYVPFAALPDPGDGGRQAVGKNTAPPVSNAQPLLAAHEIISLPSASTLAVLRQELRGRPTAPKMLAIFADPVFANDDVRRKAAALRPSSKSGTKPLPSERSLLHEEETAASSVNGKLLIPRLPYTRQEAARILSLAPNGANLMALDYQANRATATSAELAQYRYLHFATHGVLDTERPGLSALVLSLVDEMGQPQDGFLRAHEIYNLKLPAELVVLSACQTGLGKEVRGEGLLGLTRGFMYAGAARVVVSLWSVNDRATAELMTKFYRHLLQEHQRPAAALRAAQLEMWKQKQWQAPYYWAAFVLQGDWR